MVLRFVPAALGLLLVSCQIQPLREFPAEGSVAQLKQLSLPSLTFTEVGTEGDLGGDSTRHLVKLEVRAAEDSQGQRPTGPVLQESWASIWVRGQSSSGFPKKSFGLELRAQSFTLTKANAPLLGLPSENDFVLHASYSDKSLLRNYTAYTLSNRIGLWAPRVRLVEVWGLPENDGSDATAYEGIYVLVEKIKIDKNRVNVARPGGYILKIDKSGGNEYYPSGVATANLSVADPNQNELSDDEMTFITNWIQQAETALDPNAPGSWRQYLDDASFADYFLMQELTRNIDGYRISTFMHKEAGGKLKAGPLWDFDIALGNDEASWGFHPASYPDGWDRNGSDNGVPDDWPDDPDTTVNDTAFGWMIVNQLDPNWTDFSPAYWWRTLLQDDAFRSLARERWRDFRRGALSDQAISRVIDDAVDELRPGVKRNYTRWQTLNQYDWPNVWPLPDGITSHPAGNYTYEDHVRFLKRYLLGRAAWMDSDAAWTALREFSEETP